MAFVITTHLPRTGLTYGSNAVCAKPSSTHRVITAPIEIQAAKHVQWKAAKKKNKCRPKKHRPSDRNRAPPSFNPEPMRMEGLPPDYTIIPKSQIVELDEEINTEAKEPVAEEEVAEETQGPEAKQETEDESA